MKTKKILEIQALIIGGGVTGTGIARDLALRGISALVIEKGNINDGASGRNHGLLHSGVRYVGSLKIYLKNVSKARNRFYGIVNLPRQS